MQIIRSGGQPAILGPEERFTFDEEYLKGTQHADA
jgi:hypothetical protein